MFEGDMPVTLARLLVKVLVITALYTVDIHLVINLSSLPRVTSNTVMGVPVHQQQNNFASQRQTIA